MITRFDVRGEEACLHGRTPRDCDDAIVRLNDSIKADGYYLEVVSIHPSVASSFWSYDVVLRPHSQENMVCTRDKNSELTYIRKMLLYGNLKDILEDVEDDSYVSCTMSFDEFGEDIFSRFDSFREIGFNQWYRLIGRMCEATGGFTKPGKINASFRCHVYAVIWENGYWRYESIKFYEKMSKHEV